jgi:class 3 adenylate cyclase/tetratricopeptide (TPR) repeat protein
MICPQCRAENRTEAHFCRECGISFAFACPACGATVQVASNFCDSCGAALAVSTAPLSRFALPGNYTPRHLADRILTGRSALEGERKQVTVLFCDLVDSTALAERVGPEAMHAILERFFELVLTDVHRYEGTVNQFLGDGFMALFGAPLAHEDHALRAVLAALGIQRSLKDRPGDLRERHGVELAVRVGLNTGLVVVGQIGDNLRMDYTAVGDTTNLAARLQQLAEPGGILLSESTARLVRDDLRLEAVGPVRVKGKSESVPVYRVLGLRPRRSPLEAPGQRSRTRFLGREREMRELGDLLAQVEKGRGQFAGIVGEPGVGKSRVLFEFRQGLGPKRVTCLEGRCLSYGSSIPYLAILDILRSNCGIADTDSPEENAEKVRAALREVEMDPKESAPYLLSLLGMREGPSPLDAFSPETVKARTFEILSQMSLRGARLRPIVFIVEDLHWIDRTSEEFLSSFVERLARAQVLLLSTYRPEYRPPWMEKSYATQFTLQPLLPQDSVTVIHSIPRSDRMPDAVIRVILGKAEGNPFFLEELTRAVVEHEAALPTLAVPDTIQGVLMARIDRLPELPRRLLQTASVLGRECSLRLLTAIWDEPGDLLQHFHELTRLEFLYEQSGTEEPGYVFKHALTHDVAYDSLLTSRRQTLHAAAGRALEQLYADRLPEVHGRLAYHYSKADEPAKAVEYLGRVADKAVRASALEEAVSTFQEGLAQAERLESGPRDRVAVGLVPRLAEAYLLQGDLARALELLQQHQERLAGLHDAALAGPYHFWLALIHGLMADREPARAHGRRALEEATRSDDVLTMGRAYYVLASEDYWTGQFAQGVEHGRQAVTLLERTGEPWWLGMALWVLGMNASLLGDFEVALAAETRAREIGETAGDRRLQSIATFSLGLLRAFTGNCAEGVTDCRRGLELSPDPLFTAFALGTLGLACLEKGDPSEAIPALERSVEMMTLFRFEMLRGWSTIALGEAHRLNGEIERAEALVTEGLDMTRRLEHRFGVGLAQRALGRIARVRRALPEAKSSLAEALRIFASIPARFELARTHLDLAELAHASADPGAASAHLREAHRLFIALRVPRYVERSEQLARDLGTLLSA